MTAATLSPLSMGLSRWSTILPTSLLSSFNPFAASGDAVKQTQDEADAAANGIDSETIGKRSAMATVPFDEGASGPPSPSRSTGSTLFAEPDTRSNSDKSESREGSTTGKPRSNKSDRPKTRFSICHAPPASSTRQRMHRRPRSLLQLHQLSATARPQPAFEVIPSVNFSVRLTRAITKVFKSKHGLCPHDLAVRRAESYEGEEKHEDHEVRDVIGLICKGRKEEGATAAGKAKICMASGAEWEAYPMMNGGYEFFSIDEHGLGLTMRWVPKRQKDKDGNLKPKEKDVKRFNFSTISPNSRRHPVIATLSRTGLDVNDVYRMPDPFAVTPVSTPKQHASHLADVMEEESGGTRLCEIDDALREVITMTAVWVTFQEGWSPTFKYEDKEKEGLQRSPSLRSTRNSPSKTGSSPVSTPPGSPLLQPFDKRISSHSARPGLMRRTSLLSRGARNSTASVPETDENETQDPKSTDGQSTGRARGDSTSTVLMHRRPSSRRANHHQATWRPDLLSAQQDVHETSREDLNAKPTLTEVQRVDDPGSPESTLVQREAVARPLVPSAQPVSDEPRPTQASTPAVARQERPPSPEEKRDSTATTDTSIHSRRPVKSSKLSRGRKSLRGGLRRLLCGSSDEP